MAQVEGWTLGGFAACAVNCNAHMLRRACSSLWPLPAPTSAPCVAPWGSPAWVCLTLALTVVCTVGAFWLMNTWQPLVPATQAGLIYCIEPVLASVFALFLPAVFSVWASISYPNERATPSLLIGGALIMFANILVQVNWGPRKHIEAC